MDVDARVEAWASLHLVRGLTTRASLDLLKAFGGPAEILAAGRGSLTRFVSGELADDIRRGGEAKLLERTLRWIERDGHRLIAWDDPDYPPALLNLPDPPTVLFYAGRLELLARPGLA